MRRLLLLLPFVLPLATHAQSTEDQLKVRLVHQPLYFRHGWGADKLHFDTTGAVLGNVPEVSFTLSGVELDSVKLSGKELELTGVRVGLEFTGKVPKRVSLQLPSSLRRSTRPEEVKLTIDAPDGGDFAPVLDAIFTTELSDMVAHMPIEWRSFGLKNFGTGMSTTAAPATAAPPAAAGGPETPGPDAPMPEPSKLRRIGGVVAPPQGSVRARTAVHGACARHPLCRKSAVVPAGG